MASSDDDFSILADDNNNPNNPNSTPTQSNPNNLLHHHQNQAFPHRFTARSTSPQILTPSVAAALSINPKSITAGLVVIQQDEANNSTEKRNDREELSDGGTTPNTSKKARISGDGGGSGGEYRKDREEWGDTAIVCLLDAYIDKFTHLNRGNLRGRDWEEVAAAVSERCDKQSKSVEQCKNKVDNLKKRYKLERNRMNNGGVSASHWPWFKKMELIVGNSIPVKAAASEEEKSLAGSPCSLRQSKRYGTATSNPSGQITTTKSKSTINPRWRRVVFKISGAALSGSGSGSSNNLDPKIAMMIAKEVSVACRAGVEVAIVMGGRNFFCGDSWVTSTGLDRCTAYQTGMMATVMNSVLIQSVLEKMGVESRIQTGFSMVEVSEPYSRQRAIRHLEKGRVVIFGGVGAGTGNPLFSTDTAAALRASEIHADAVLKGINIDAVYDCNTRSNNNNNDNNNNNAFEHISFRALASSGASLMDMMAVTYCEENGIPVVIFNLHEPGNISKALCGEQVGTLIDQTGRAS